MNFYCSHFRSPFTADFVIFDDLFSPELISKHITDTTMTYPGLVDYSLKLSTFYFFYASGTIFLELNFTRKLGTNMQSNFNFVEKKCRIVCLLKDVQSKSHSEKINRK